MREIQVVGLQYLYTDDACINKKSRYFAMSGCGAVLLKFYLSWIKTKCNARRLKRHVMMKQ